MSKSATASPVCHSQDFDVGRHIEGGFFRGSTVPDKCQYFTLVRASGRRDGVIHPGGVNHGDMCLTPEHGQLHPELLNIDHKIAECRQICQVARGSPELHGELGLDGCRVIHFVPQFLTDGVDAGVCRIPTPPSEACGPCFLRWGWGWVHSTPYRRGGVGRGTPNAGTAWGRGMPCSLCVCVTGTTGSQSRPPPPHC